MEGALSLVGLAAAALLVVAIAVAWWEQTATDGRAAAVSPRPHAVAVDIDLDHLDNDVAISADDQATRHTVLGNAMARMAQPPACSTVWLDTQPIVAPGARADPVPSSWG